MEVVISFLSTFLPFTQLFRGVNGRIDLSNTFLQHDWNLASWCSHGCAVHWSMYHCPGPIFQHVRSSKDCFNLVSRESKDAGNHIRCCG